MQFNIYMDDVRSGPFNNIIEPIDSWHDWIICRSAEAVKILLQTGMVDKLDLDNDMGINTKTGLLQESGVSLLRWMINHECFNNGEINFHSANIAAQQEASGLINVINQMRSETKDK